MSVSVSALTSCGLFQKSVPLHIHFLLSNMELLTADARYEKTWHQFLSKLEREPRLRLAVFLRSVHVHQRGFEKWLYSHGYSVQEAKRRVHRFCEDSDTGVSSVSEPPSILPVCVQSEPDVPVNPHDVLTGISLTLPDGTVVSIRRGSAEAVVSFLKLYTGEASPCSD